MGNPHGTARRADFFSKEFPRIRPFFAIMRFMGLRARAGQAALEYVLALCALLVVVGAMWYLVAAARRSVVRTESLVSSDYP